MQVKTDEKNFGKTDLQILILYIYTMEKESKIQEKELSLWWSNLRIAYKERIASKANKRTVLYPECSEWWNGVSIEMKQKIYKHCSEDHGYYLEPWKDGKCFT